MTRTTTSAALVLLLVPVGFMAVGCGHQASTVGEQSSPSVRPPDWLLERMTSLVRDAGDVDATARWTLTTAESASALDGEGAPARPANPDRPVYVFVVHGDFSNWQWSLPYGASSPKYSWVLNLVDAHSRVGDMLSAGAKPFDTSGPDTHPITLSRQQDGG